MFQFRDNYELPADLVKDKDTAMNYLNIQKDLEIKIYYRIRDYLPRGWTGWTDKAPKYYYEPIVPAEFISIWNTKLAHYFIHTKNLLVWIEEHYLKETNYKEVLHTWQEKVTHHYKLNMKRIDALLKFEKHVHSVPYFEIERKLNNYWNNIDELEKDFK